MMSSRRVENRPPRSPKSKKGTMIEVPLDKRRRIVGNRPGGPTSTVRGRQALTEVSARQDASSTGNSSNMEGVESEVMEFTKEGVEMLLNEKPKAKKHELKARLEHLTDYNRRLKLCIKWFQQVEQSHLLEKDRLQNSLESAEKRCLEIELEKEKKVGELNATIAELRSSNALLEEKIAKETSEKLDALNSYAKEKDQRAAAERLQASLSVELEKSKQEKLDADQQIAAQKEMYKRLQEYNTSLQQYNSKLQTDVSTTTESLKRAEKEKMAIVENLSTLRGHYNTLQEQLSSFRASADEAIKMKETLVNEVKCLREELQKVREDRDRQIGQVQALTADVLKYQEATGKSVIELDNLTIKINALQETCSSQMEQIHILQHQLTAANEKLKMADLSTVEMRSHYEEQKKIISELQDKLANSEQQVLEGEQLRKKLHNTILELKGNIRVFCRVRPLLPDESYGSEPVISYPMSTESLGRGIELLQSGGQKYPFTFDKVFNPEASQEDVFYEISQLIQSALDGYKVCIFAYGQTGSGKTYTMMGRPDAPEQKGLIPRSLEQIFQTSQALSAQGWKYRLQASVLEIYNETVRDLLLTNRSQGLEITRNEGGAGGKQFTIKHDANGMTHVSDLTIVDVSSVKELSTLLQQAAQSRSVGKTQMNEQSSRSHFVFTLRIFGTNENTEQQVHGVLNLIDLAGSERLSKSGATGDRLKETQAINKSLSSLSDVIFALAKKEDHVPFRNSKLTYLLQPCLGGDSKTLMFVNISPEPTSVGESLCSLRFAARVNACEIGVPRRQTSMRLVDSRLSCG